MSPAEMSYQLLRDLQARAERSGWIGTGEPPPPDLSNRSKTWIHAPALAAQPYVRAAERIAQGRLDIFALQVEIGTPPRWNRDPKTGIEAPLAFGKTLDYRDPDLVGDIKYLWQLNRHSHLVSLAQAYALTHDRIHFEIIAEHLESWFLACPHRLGANWSSALEAGLRLINWSLTWQLLGGVESQIFQEKDHAELRARWLRSVFEHAQFIRGWFSLHSSADHRLIGEAAGLYVAALTWPHWREARAWRAAAEAILEREALAQSAPEGVNREQSVCGQRFALELLILCLAAAAANGERFSAEYESRIEAMLDFIASIMDLGGNVPMFGPCDDGAMARLSPAENSCPYKSLLATGAILFKRGDFKLKAGRLDDAARWLIGPGADARFSELDAAKTRLPLKQAFAESGYYILGCEFDTPNEIRLVADAGSLGYRAPATHGHADALSFTLSAGGREFLVDPGTYAWHTQERWQQYFRGTAAHNALRIDGLDQCESDGGSRWLTKARAGCSLWLSSAAKDSFEGWHEGYLRLEDPAKHRRLIELDKRSRRVLIEDTLEMAEVHAIELFFHCSERCSVDPIEGGYLIRQDSTSIELKLPQAETSTTQLYRGSVAPILGWVSRALDSREAAHSIVWQARLSGRAVLRTEIVINS